MNARIVGIAFVNDQDIKKLKKELNFGFLAMAKLLTANLDGKFYQMLGYDTFDSYIAQEDLGFQRRTAYTLIGIYKDLILGLNVQPVALDTIDYTKLDMIRHEATPENIEDLLTKARTLSKSDLKIEVTGREHEHEFKMQCRCGAQE